MRRCPYCGEQIESSTSKCPFCGSVVEPEPELENDEQDQAGYAGSKDGINNEGMLGQGQSNNQPTVPPGTLSNGFKVFIAMLATVPLIGQLVGIIMAIIYMNSEGDPDKKSFGKALLIGTLVIFLLICICCISYVAFSMYIAQQMGPEFFEQFQQQYQQ